MLETFWPEVPKVCVCVSVVCVVCVCVLEPRNIPAKGAQSVCVCFVGEVEVGGCFGACTLEISVWVCLSVVCVCVCVRVGAHTLETF